MPERTRQAEESDITTSGVTGLAKRRYFGATLITIAIGLGSRHIAQGHRLPWLISKYPGDVLYAVMFYWIARVCAPTSPPARIAVAAFVVSTAIEVLKLVHTPWLDAARTVPFIRLALGIGFHAANIVCYAIGSVLAASIDKAPAGRVGTLETPT